MRKTRFVFILCCIVLLVACAPKSGKKNHEIVLSYTEHEYKERFDFIEVLGKNEEGYEVLLLSPKSNPDIQFHAYLYYDGTGMPHNGSSDDYLDVAFLHFAPALYEKHFGISINKKQVLDNYFSYIKKGQFDYIHSPGFEDFLDTTDFVIRDINKENMEEKAEKIANVLLDFVEIHPYSVMKEGNDSSYNVFRASVPFEFTGEDYPDNGLFNSINTSWVYEEPDPIQKVYSRLLELWEERIEKKEQP